MDTSENILLIISEIRECNAYLLDEIVLHIEQGLDSHEKDCTRSDMIPNDSMMFYFQVTRGQMKEWIKVLKGKQIKKIGK